MNESVHGSCSATVTTRLHLDVAGVLLCFHNQHNQSRLLVSQGSQRGDREKGCPVLTEGMETTLHPLPLRGCFVSVLLLQLTFVSPQVWWVALGCCEHTGCVETFCEALLSLRRSPLPTQFFSVGMPVQYTAIRRAATHVHDIAHRILRDPLDHRNALTLQHKNQKN